MIRKINEAVSMDELFDSIRRNAEAIITDIDEIEGTDCKLDNEGMSLLKKAQKEIIGVRSRMSGIRTSCSAMYGKKTESTNERLREDVDNIDGYAVQVQDMGKGYHHLLLFSNESDAENAYDQLDSLSEYEVVYEDDEESYYDEINAIVDTCDEIVNEIDWRKEIDKNNIWTAYDDTKYQIVGTTYLDVYW